MYIDDVLSLGDVKTLNEGKELQRQLIGIFEKGGMFLHDKKFMQSSLKTIDNIRCVWTKASIVFAFHIKTDLKSYNKRCSFYNCMIIWPFGFVKTNYNWRKQWFSRLLKFGWLDLLPSEEEQKWKSLLNPYTISKQIKHWSVYFTEKPSSDRIAWFFQCLGNNLRC